MREWALRAGDTARRAQRGLPRGNSRVMLHYARALIRAGKGVRKKESSEFVNLDVATWKTY